MSGLRITVDDEDRIQVDGGGVWTWSLDVQAPHGVAYTDFMAALRSALAAPGSDPAPKVGDRVQNVESGRIATVEEIYPPTVVVEDVHGTGLTEWHGSLYRLVPGAPSGVSETEGDQPEAGEDDQ